MTRTLAALLVLALAEWGCGATKVVMDAGPYDAGPVVDSGPCSQGNACGETPPPSQCSGAEDGGCTFDFGCYCATLEDGTCGWDVLPTCADAGTVPDAGAQTDAGTEPRG